MVRFRKKKTPATTQSSTFDDVGIVYRDHNDVVVGVGEQPIIDSSTISSDDNKKILPLSIDDSDLNDLLEEEQDNGDMIINNENSDDDESSDDEEDDHDGASYYTSHFLLRKRHPAYTPHLFITHPHLAVLPVLLLEFLSLALTRAVLPSLLLKRYGSHTYMVMGGAECIRGILAFFACPLFGKLSDIWGRRPCLLVTVFGTLAPVCSLAFWKMEEYSMGISNYPSVVNEEVESITGSDTIRNELGGDAVLDGVDAGEASEASWFGTVGAESTPNASNSSFPLMDVMPSIHRIDVFVALLALSGMFSSTFTLTFAYISDVVKDRDGRVAAYGLALATFGLSFTIGPLLGGYLANVDDEGKGQGGRNFMRMFHLDDENENNSDESEHTAHHFGSSKNSDIHPLGQHRVFITSLILAILDLFYIHFLLPESLGSSKRDEMEHTSDFIDVSVNGETDESEGDYNDTPSSTTMATTSDTSNVPLPAGVGVSRRASSSFWNPFDSVRYLMTDPLLSTIGRVTFLYYTALHAVVSTLVLYAARQFHLGPQRLGELMAALGLSTMVSEAVLVRIAIPLFGETSCMRIGLISFALQCVLLAVADSPWHLFACAFLAMAGNLVYPSVSSLVSSTVRPDMVGRALGAVNGVKSLTEGIGPLLFGSLLTMSEKDRLPGWPYFLAAIMVALAYQAARKLPDQKVDKSELYPSNHTEDFEEEYIGLVNGSRAG